MQRGIPPSGAASHVLSAQSVAVWRSAFDAMLAAAWQAARQAVSSEKQLSRQLTSAAQDIGATVLTSVGLSVGVAESVGGLASGIAVTSPPPASLRASLGAAASLPPSVTEGEEPHATANIAAAIHRAESLIGRSFRARGRRSAAAYGPMIRTLQRRIRRSQGARGERRAPHAANATNRRSSRAGALEAWMTRARVVAHHRGPCVTVASAIGKTGRLARGPLWARWRRSIED
jgi:hypothetical protein